MLEYLLYNWGGSKGSLCNFSQESMVQATSNIFHVNCDMISHVICDLGKIENDTDKSPNIIEDYETSKKLFTEEYILTREKVGENTVPQLLPATSDEIQKKSRKARKELRNLSGAMKEH